MLSLVTHLVPSRTTAPVQPHPGTTPKSQGTPGRLPTRWPGPLPLGGRWWLSVLGPLCRGWAPGGHRSTQTRALGSQGIKRGIRGRPNAVPVDPVTVLSGFTHRVTRMHRPRGLPHSPQSRGPGALQPPSRAGPHCEAWWGLRAGGRCCGGRRLGLSTQLQRRPQALGCCDPGRVSSALHHFLGAAWELRRSAPGACPLSSWLLHCTQMAAGLRASGHSPLHFTIAGVTGVAVGSLSVLGHGEGHLGGVALLEEVRHCGAGSEVSYAPATPSVAHSLLLPGGPDGEPAASPAPRLPAR